MEEICINKKKKRKSVVFLLSAVTILAAVGFVTAAEKYIMPPAAEICAAEAKERANTIINSSAEQVLADNGIRLADIINVSQSTDGTAIISADTAAVNMICTKLSQSITQKMLAAENIKVEIPLGAASGIGVLANTGPDIAFEIRQAGGTDVDYDTQFSSAGINQTNYKIWLTVNMTVSLVNPLYNRQISMTRKIMLADVIIKGEVPSGFLTLPQS